MSGSGGGFLNTDKGALISGLGISPKKIGGFVQDNPWVIPVAAAAATVFTGGAAAPALAGAMGAGEAAAGGAAAGGAAAGLGAAEGAGALSAGAGAMDAAGFAGTGLLDAGAGAGSLADLAPIAADAPIPIDASTAFGTMGPGINPYVGGQSIFSGFDPTKMGMRLMNQSLQPQTPQPIPASGGRPQAQPTPNYGQFTAMNQPMGQPSTPGSAGGMFNKPFTSIGGEADILKRLGLLGGTQ